MNPVGRSWSVSSDTSPLKEVLLCPPTYYPTHAFSYNAWKDLTGLEHEVTRSYLMNIYSDLVEVLSGQGVKCHELVPDPVSPFQVFTRDSAVVGPWGPVLTSFSSKIRIREKRNIRSFFQKALRNGLVSEIFDPIQKGSLEGGDVHIIRDGVVLIGVNEKRTTTAGAQYFAETFLSRGWDVYFQKFSESISHLDMVFSMVNDELAVAYFDKIHESFSHLLRILKIKTISANEIEGNTLGCNMLSLGNDTVISSTHAKELNSKLKAEGINVIQVNLTAFAVDEGSVRCMTQPLLRKKDS